MNKFRNLIRPNSEPFAPITRRLSSSKVTEDELLEILKKAFPSAKEITVKDTSGGVGEMFQIMVHSSEFDGLSIKKQHTSVYDALKDKIKQMHGLHVETKAVKPVNKE